MATDPNLNPAHPKPFPPHTVQAPTTPGLPEKEGDPERLQQTADRLAHKAAKAEQDFDREHSKPFTK